MFLQVRVVTLKIANFMKFSQQLRIQNENGTTLVFPSTGHNVLQNPVTNLYL